MFGRLSSSTSLFGNVRSALVTKNIVISLLVKAAGLLISLLLVPLSLEYICKEEYGIWLTISSILYWFAFLDVGLSNGMRNYMSAAISIGDYVKASKYFTTTVVLLSIIFSIAFIISLGVIPFLSIDKIFNTNLLDNRALQVDLLVAIGFTLVGFVGKNIGYVYVAHQHYSVMDVLGFLGHLGGLVAMFVLSKTTNGNLLYLILVMTVLPVLVYLFASFPTFKRYPQLLPNKRSVDFSLFNQIVGKGLGFFAIQITSCLVIFGGTNVIISHYCGPESVTEYNLSFRVFNILIIAYTAFISPLWNGYTDASVKGDWKWIRKAFMRSVLIWFFSVLGGIILLFLCEPFYGIWLKGKVTIPFSISLCTFLYVCFFNLNNCATYLINGLNAIRVQIISSVVVTILYVISVCLLENSFGAEGIILCVTICYALMSILHLYQCHLLINCKANGIWIK